MLHHGGNLLAAARQYGIPAEHWLDLSTGINPIGYPVGQIEPSAWLRLPQADDGLLEIASRYYGTTHLLAAAGSQALIQLLPQLRPPSRVAIPHPSYNEHPKAWELAGHQVLRFEPERAAEQIEHCDVLLLCHPNNPSGQRYSREQLLSWHAQLTRRGGWLVIDEAFIDATPQDSLAFAVGQPGLLILRSLGKFFGLAGARVGFLLAWPELLQQVGERLGPWQISGPSRVVAARALADLEWQRQTRQRLRDAAPRLTALLARYQLQITACTALFQWVLHPNAAHLHQQLAQQAILTRLFDQPSSLRFGLPGDEWQWTKLEQALAAVRWC